MTTEPRPLHTPGPWIAEESSTGWAVYSKDGKAITGWGRVTQTEANAALIARAPELLEENERLKARVAELEQLNGKHANAAANLATQIEPFNQENARLRELLRECKKYLPLKGHTYNAMECQESKLGERIDKELSQ